jgi:hypothetical protein
MHNAFAVRFGGESSHAAAGHWLVITGIVIGSVLLASCAILAILATLASGYNGASTPVPDAPEQDAWREFLRQTGAVNEHERRVSFGFLLGELARPDRLAEIRALSDHVRPASRYWLIESPAQTLLPLMVAAGQLEPADWVELDRELLAISRSRHAPA